MTFLYVKQLTRVALLLGLQASILFSSSLRATPDFHSKKFDTFITREGDRLMEGERELRFAGANMPGLTLPYDYTLRLPERLVLPTEWEQEDGFKTLQQMGARVVRLWNLPIRGPGDDWMGWAHVQGPGQFNEEAFQCIDRALALANRYGIRVIFPFTAEAGDYLGGIGTYADWRDKKRLEFFTDPQVRADFKATLAYVLNRRNTVTGQLYREDKAILAWELGNELRSAPVAWEVEMADYLKSLDPNHLVLAGNDKRLMEDPPDSIDILNRHYYGENWAERCRDDRAQTTGRRPLIIGEYGGTTDMDAVREFHNEALANGTSGHLIWSMYFHHREGGFYWHQVFTHDDISSLHWPGFDSGSRQNERELLGIIRDSAFRMAGLEAPPVPVPESPEILFSGELPLLSWRGSAGATGYVIERAESPDGPWTRVAENVSDAAVAYRPLWADETARLDTGYFYRISALNESGVSAPSLPSGPVRFRRQVLVDELENFAACQRHSEGLKLTNDRSGLYAEYLYRVKAEAGDEIVYRVPGQATRVRLWAFMPDPGKLPQLAFASLNGTFTELPFQLVSSRTLRTMARVTQLAGRENTLVEIEAALPPDMQSDPAVYIRLQWTGLMELDRIEIEYLPRIHHPVSSVYP